MSSPRNYPRAALTALIAFSGWTFSDALLKLVRTEGVPLGEVLLISGMSGMVVIFLISALRGRLSHLQPRKWKGLIILGFAQWGSFSCWMIALPHLPLANMYVVSFLTPMTVACMAALILKEHMGWKRAFAIATGFLGVIIAINPEKLLHQDGAWFPYFILFGSMICSATQMFLLRAVANKEASDSTSFYPRAMLVIAGLFSCGTNGFVALAPLPFIFLCTSGALGGIGWGLLARAYRDAPAAAVAPFQYWQMIMGALVGYLIWNDTPSLSLLWGGAIIIASGIYLVRHERRISRMMVRTD